MTMDLTLWLSQNYISISLVTIVVLLIRKLFSQWFGEEPEPVNREAKSADEIPGPYRLPVIGSAWKYIPYIGGYSFARQFETHMKMYKKYGKIVREQFGEEFNFIRLYDEKDVTKVLRNESKYPKRPTMAPLLKVAEILHLPPNMGAIDGEEWHRQRVALQTVAINGKIIGQYLADQDQVAMDFMTFLEDRLDGNRETKDLTEDLMHYALEAVGLVCYHKRLGLFDKVTKDEEEARDGHKVLSLTKRINKHLLPMMMKWDLVKKGYYKKEFEEWTKNIGMLNRISHKFVGEAVHSKDGNSDNLILKKLLQDETVTYEEAVHMMDNLLGAGVESTAFSISLMIYNLVQNPEKQEALYQELRKEVTPGKALAPEELEDGLRYMKAAVKETQRMSPAAVVSTIRTLEEDIVLSGYKIPKGWNIAVENAVMGRLPHYFEDPDKFEPERWLKASGKDKNSTYTVSPFGIGSRSCPGWKVAMQELYLCIIRIVLTYKIEYHHEPLGTVTETFQHLDKPFRVKLVKRQQEPESIGAL